MSANETNSKLLATVRGLLAKAENTEFEAERDAFRAKADELMVKYAISHYDLDASGAAKQSKFGAYEFDLKWYWELKGANHEFRYYTFQMMGYIRHHCRLVQGPQRGDALIMIGLKSDFEFFEMLFTSLLMEMTRTMSPSWKASISPEQNVVAFKHAGFKWQNIADQLLLHTDMPIKRQKNGQLHGCYIAMYKQGLKQLGLSLTEQVKVQPQVHLRSFCIGFNERLYGRLLAMRDAISNEPGTGLVLLDMSKELAEFAKNSFPEHFAPPKDTGRSVGRVRYVKTSRSSKAAGRAAADRADLGGSKLGQRRELT